MADRPGLPDAFFALLRKTTKAGVWSQGVSLSRDGQVAVESRDADEIVLRVKAPGRPVAPTVVLYPGEREWDCDCGGRMNPCEHVAAAAIALTAGETESASSGPPPAAEVWGRLVYRFARAGAGLRLERFIASGRTGAGAAAGGNADVAAVETGAGRQGAARATRSEGRSAAGHWRAAGCCPPASWTP